MRSRLESFVLALAAAAALGGTAATAVADDVKTITSNPSSLSASELDARIAFIEERLDAHRKHAYYWQYGWTAAYGSGLVIQSVRAGVTKDDENRADYVVSAVKAAGGVARLLLRPHPATHGADPLREMGGDTREAKERKLAKAEEMLLGTAKFSDRRFSQKAHIANVLVNVAGGAIIWGLGAPLHAVQSTLVGIGVGASQIVSAPWYGDEDLDEYEARFSGGTTRGWDWKLVPTVGGAAVQVTF